MPQKDIYHDVVIHALTKDGWTITDDPLRLAYGGRNVYVDLGAEQPIGAEKAGRKIAVEIKSFLGESDVQELGESVGKYKLKMSKKGLSYGNLNTLSTNSLRSSPAICAQAVARGNYAGSHC